MSKISTFKAPLRAEEDRSDRSATIRKAALKLFNENGFAATSLEDVAREADVSKGTIYLYFESKEDLFFAILRGILPEINHRTDQLNQVETAIGPALRSLIIHIGQQMIHDEFGICIRLIVSEARQFPEIEQYYRDNIVSRGIDAFSRAIDKGIENGEFRPVDSRSTAALLIFPLLMAGIWENALPGLNEIDLEEVVVAHADNFLMSLRP